MVPEQYALDFQSRVLQRIDAPDWSWEEACSMGIMARNYRDLSNWVIGTISLGIEKKWGEDRLGEFAKLLGFRKDLIQQYRWVVKKFGTAYNPTEGLPWSFYRVAAGTENPEKTIEHFTDNNLSYVEAERYAKGLPSARECVHEYEIITLEKCKNCGITHKKLNQGGDI